MAGGRPPVVGQSLYVARAHRVSINRAPADAAHDGEGRDPAVLKRPKWGSRAFIKPANKLPSLGVEKARGAPRSPRARHSQREEELTKCHALSLLVLAAAAASLGQFGAGHAAELDPA